MTVISRKQQNYEYPNSNNGSDTESMHLPSASASDVESDTNEPSATNGPSQQPQRVAIYEDLGRLKKNLGKRKQRRFRNRSELQVLSEEDEDEAQPVKLMEDSKSPFARLLEDRDAMLYWNEFTNLPEVEQHKLVEAVPKTKVLKTEVLKTETEPRNPLTKLSAKIRRAMKIKKNLPVDLMYKTEADILEYFKTAPGGVFVATPRTSFERLLLHAVAQYHSLKSISLMGKTVRCVEVSSPSNWKPMETFFRDYVKTLRQ